MFLFTTEILANIHISEAGTCEQFCSDVIGSHFARLTFSSSLRLAVKLLASDRRSAQSIGGGACLDGGSASTGDGVE